MAGTGWMTETEKRHYLALSRVSWAITGLLLALDALLLALLPISATASKIPIGLMVFVYAGIVGLVYTRWRFDPLISSVSQSVANISIFVVLCALLTYLAANFGRSIPFQDAALLHVDQAFQLDWVGWLGWLNERPSLAWMLTQAYASLVPQGVILVLLLSGCRQQIRLQTFILAFQIAAISCAVLSGLIPALGVYAHLGIERSVHHLNLDLYWMANHIPDVLLARDTPAVVRIEEMTGIVVFPSFHAALGLLFAWAFWRIPVARWLALAANVALIAATPVIGGHYFADIPAGLAVAALSIAIALRIERSRPRPLPHALPGLAGRPGWADRPLPRDSELPCGTRR